jgi:hypothetical protein
VSHRGAWAAALAAVALVAGMLPFRSILPLFPCGRDAIRWIVETDPSEPGWASWVFLDNHFVAYRPVTGLLFTLNHLLFGDTPWSWRAVDIGLHVVTGLLVAAVWAALSNVGPSWGGPTRRPGATLGWGVLAAALFWCNPVGEAVVPFVARRSYSLATALGLAALATWASAEGPETRRAGLRRGIAAGMLLAAALANETAYVLVPVLALVSVVARWRTGIRTLALDLAPLVVATAIGVTLRLAILGRLGGYQHRLTARVEDGVRVVHVGSSPHEVFGLAWAEAALPESPSGDPSFALALGGVWVGVALAAWAVAWSVRALGARRDALPLLLLVWATGYALLTAISGTWFVRMAYPMAVPVALWLAWAAAETARSVRARRVGAWHLVPLLLVLAARLQVATPVRGIDRKPIREQYRSTRFVRSAARDLRAVGAPALVWVAVPIDVTRLGSTMRWLRLHAPEGIEVRSLAMTDPNAWPRGPMLERNDRTVRPLTGARWDPRIPTGGRTPLPLGALFRDDRPVWILDGDALTQLPQMPPMPMSPGSPETRIPQQHRDR